jgi:hypothetical protein
MNKSVGATELFVFASQEFEQNQHDTGSRSEEEDNIDNGSKLADFRR